MSALAIRPEQEAQAVAGVEAATSLVERIADGLQVVDDASAGQAEELLQRITRELKGHEAARVELVKPLNDHVRAINGRFKTATVPAERAKKTVGDKLLAYRAEQERLRREAEEAERRRREEEQRRLDEERRAAEAAARAEREAAAREAARKEAEAREAERKRREEMERQAGERAAYVAGLADPDLRALLIDGEYGDPARAELDAREKARKAKEEAAAAREREEQARLAEEAARQAPRAVATPAPVAVAAPAPSPVASRKVWRAEVIDETRVPREYLTVDLVAINKAVRAGVRSIPGVDIRQHDQLAVRAA